MGVRRASRSRVQVPPTGFLLAPERLERPPAAPAGDPPLRCRASTETGFCGAAFHTRKALLNHYRAHHNVRSLAHVITPTHICVHCRQIFSSKITALRHLLGSILGAVVVRLGRGYWGSYFSLDN
eukprot:81687-Pyramimonas_sp.AAC.1